MNKPSYYFTIEVTEAQKEMLEKAFAMGSAIIVRIKDVDVFAGICNILGNNDFRPCRMGMVREKTGCSFGWGTIASYTTVVDFQLDWPYS